MILVLLRYFSHEKLILLFTWKLISQVPWGQISISGCVPKRYSKSLAIYKANKLVRYHWPSQGMQLQTDTLNWWAGDWQTVTLCSCSSTRCILCLSGARILLLYKCKSIKPVNQKCTYSPGVGITMKLIREMGRESQRICCGGKNSLYLSPG